MHCADRKREQTSFSLPRQILKSFQHWKMPIRRKLLALALGIICMFAPRSLGANQTYCNPLDLDYKYNFEGRRMNTSYRSGADPVLINHQGEYFLFGTIAGGYWHSKNLRDWR